MSSKKVIFYSWQSDTDKKINNYFIKDALKIALKKLNKESESEISFDSDTLNTSGSGNIVDIIFGKIRSSSIFLCDVTSVGTVNGSAKKVSNSNVMIELGYAVKSLSWDRIICINNLFYGKPDELPFDIRQNRISSFFLSDDMNLEKKKKAKEDLVKLIYTAIKQILDDYDNILLRVKKDDFIEYDKKIFDKIEEIFPESIIIEITTQIANKKINKFQYKEIDNLIEFKKLLQNSFIDNDLETEFKNFVKNLTELHKTMKKWEYLMKKYNEYKKMYKGFGSGNYHNFIYEDLEDNRKKLSVEIIDKANNMKKNYQEFRVLVKKKLLI